MAFNHDLISRMFNCLHNCLNSTRKNHDLLNTWLSVGTVNWRLEHVWVCGCTRHSGHMATHLQMVKLDVLPNKSYGFRLLHLSSLSAQKFGKRFRYCHGRWSRFSTFSLNFSIHLHSFSLWLLWSNKIESYLD